MKDFKKNAHRISPTWNAIKSDVAVERTAQDMQWGGPDYDDGQTTGFWQNLIVDHAERLSDCMGAPAADYRRRLVKIAAIAVAAIESHDRNPPELSETMQ